jgi:hypothetical protein
MEMTSKAMPNIANAPRDLEALTNQGVFLHRRLAEELDAAGYKLWSSDQEKTAFVTSTPRERAAAILRMLQSYDSQGRGGAPATSARQPAAPSAPAEAAPVVSKRAPKTAADTPSPGNGTPSGTPVQELLMAIKSIHEDVRATLNGLSGMGLAVSKAKDDVTNLTGVMSGILRIQRVQLGLLYLFGQQVLNAPGEDIVTAAMDDCDTVLALIDKIAKGK